MPPIGTAEAVMLMLLFGVVAILFVLPFWIICRRAGLSPWLSLLMIVPPGAVILAFILAFVDWPALRNAENRERPPNRH